LAVDGGGGIYNTRGDLTLNKVEVISNYAQKEGGGLFIRMGTATLIDTQVLSNTTSNSGGGLYSLGQITVTNSVFKDNKTTSVLGGTKRGGGGIWAAGPVSLSGVRVLSNITAQNGGGIYLENNVSTITNTIIVDNQANMSGGGLYITGSIVNLLHTTMARNNGGDGSGVSIFISTVALTNTILMSQAMGITAAADSTATLNGVLWYSNTVNTGGAGTITLMNEYTDDPAFAADGYHLTANSAAIDKGVNAWVTIDIDGDPRPVDGNLDDIALADLGADEFLPSIYLPLIFKDFRS
jgi:predicted outer membrane repeat protein